jgi:hypothetical protein
MRLVSVIVPMLAASLAVPAMAQGLQLFRPSGEIFDSWSCSFDALGEDGGALGVSDDELIGVDTRCTLVEPVPVRNMTATLYFAQCTSEGERYTERVMIMPSPNGVYIIRDGQVFEWDRCPAP